VRGRNSHNDLIRSRLHWEPRAPLRSGLERTYAWVSAEVSRKYGSTLRRAGSQDHRRLPV
jgi:hypothetical protein